MPIPFGTKIPWPVPAPETPPKSAGLKKERQSPPMLMPETKRFLLSALATAVVLLAVYGMCQYIGMTIGLVALAVLVAIVTTGVHAAETNRPLLHESAGAATVAATLGAQLALGFWLKHGENQHLDLPIFVFTSILFFVGAVWVANRIDANRLDKSMLFIMNTGFVAVFAWIGISALVQFLQASG